MARPLRIVLPDTWYHVMNRGHRRGAVLPRRCELAGFAGPGRERFGRNGSLCPDGGIHLLRAGARTTTGDPVVQDWWRLVLGEERTALRLLAGRPLHIEEQTEARRLRRRVRWGAVRRERRRSGRRVGAMGRTLWRLGSGRARYVAARFGGCPLVEAVRSCPACVMRRPPKA